MKIMEINEIKGCWKEEGKRISGNVKVNKDASFKNLRTSLDRVRIRRLFRLIQMCVVIPLILVLIVFPHMKNDDSTLFYLALTSFILPILLFFSTYVYYYICLLKIDFSESLMEAQKEIFRLEILEKKLNIVGLIIVPILTLSTFKIFGIPCKPEAIIMMVLIAVTMVASYIIKMKVLIPKEYSKVKSYLDEMEENK